MLSRSGLGSGFSFLDVEVCLALACGFSGLGLSVLSGSGLSMLRL